MTQKNEIQVTERIDSLSALQISSNKLVNMFTEP